MGRPFVRGVQELEQVRAELLSRDPESRWMRESVVC
jgi:hypothetical protein